MSENNNKTLNAAVSDKDMEKVTGGFSRPDIDTETLIKGNKDAQILVDLNNKPVQKSNSEVKDLLKSIR